ncbi:MULTISPECIES: Zn-dependent hydrolase [Burkholderia]|uniref:N-carbamoyl-L-amino acid hydrolase (L-carbamoylase) n=1 Tax=Burkholderia multivorans CGD2 TaxID=513052 RepID=B9BLB5_9BURK|nr:MULTISPECIES: Zn-dependent hydrolase [Burkholderia]EEE08732.1 N-carbamoyl-L-amino acid hydrolase (L-carbamoylase) [Burkholderia multivorans CGD2]EEE16418.1 N-carbamoyl-L-amino acid hydrolase (L-carbamoylase) [Burkholderia multivorans CGD2M]MBJ9680664.1 Zn-dependent hydrolase [Burkholderia multivorans]MBU9150438.1 Zn-dependent hydrolase [Burkholderia multivorans]MBU9313566.1 Zn-dependent hydrolase [Burkholderia multivorans]
MMRVNRQRLWDSLMEMATIGATARGGSCRLALSDDEVRGRRRFIAWCEAAGCEIRIDPIGNLFARRPGTEPDAPAVMCGSHLDTQPLGGRFDGVYGVLAGLEAIRTLNEHGIATRHPIDVVAWTNEEGSRFTPGMMGSAVYAGKLDLDDALARPCMHSGVRLGDELERTGFAGPARERQMPKAYFEAHIEQGPVLENAGVPIGVVTGVQGIVELDVTVTGFESHAGTTPMSVRKDAMGVAAAMIAAIVEHGHGFDADARVTVGHLACQPNSPSTIPGQVRFSVDVRHPSRSALQRLVADIGAICTERTALRGTHVDVQRIAEYDPIAFDAACIERVRQATIAAGYPYLEMFSGAGHDAVNLSYVAPSAMVFVPCKAGLSHNEAEDADPVHLAQGASVLANLLVDCAR